MFLDLTSLIIMAIATAMGVFLILLILGSGKYDNMIQPLDPAEFRFCQLYGIGFALLHLFRHDYTKKGDRKRRQQLALIYGEKHSEYYLRVYAAQGMTYAAILTTLGFALYGLAGDITIVVVMVAFAATAYYFVGTLPQRMLEAKSEAVLSQFAEVVSKLALLINAGMILREAWEKIAEKGEGELYTEMRRVVDSVNNGVSEIDAFTEFGTRCTAPEIKKFTSTLIQGMVKGNRELVEMIKQQSREFWDGKQHRARQQGEKAASKLLIPICIMFLGIVLMIVVPIFANLGV